ncbi:MAG: DMT family transporter [Spirochaetia bacterium]|jgi:drug/metabolite transporter (DMT)-like permease|nr:DMT family transporter [Spirochaetia bacterium]
MATSKKTAIILATATAFIWGMSFLSIKTAVTVVPPMSLGLFRFIVASIVLFIVFIARRKPFLLTLKDLPLMAGSGLVGVTLYFMGENNGILLLSASEASIIVGTIPVLTMITERVFMRGKISAAQYGGAGLSAIGVSLIVIESLRLSPAPLGYLFMGMAAMSWVGYVFLTKPLLAKYDSLEITFWQSAFGALGFLPFAFFEHIAWSAMSALIVANVLYLGIFCSAIGYLFYIISLDSLGPGVSSVFINLIPVVSVASSFVILGERLSLIQMMGGLIAIGGVYTTSLAKGKKGRRQGLSRRPRPPV